MTFETLAEELSASQDAVSRALVDDIRAARVAPVLPGPGREAAHSVRATFSIRARTTVASGISTLGIEETLAHLSALAPEDSVLLFHFSGAKRVFSVFVREADQSIVGVLMVERRQDGA
jgi:hypothetical protein